MSRRRMKELNKLNKKPYYGSEMGPRRKGTFRCISANMNNFPVEASHPKNITFIANMKKHQGDIFLLQEHGLNERKLSEEARLKGRIEPAFRMGEVKVTTAYNRHFAPEHPRAKRCYGGTATITSFELAPYACGSGIDETGMGRWAWSRIQGRDGTRATFYSVYRCCNNKTGSESA